MPVTEEQILDALQAVQIPGENQSVVALGLISGLAVKDGLVHISIETSPENVPEMEEVRQACEAAMRGVPGVQNATAVLTAEKPQAPPTPQTAAPRPQNPRTTCGR